MLKARKINEEKTNKNAMNLHYWLTWHACVVMFMTCVVMV